jgi:predicted outer membrane protein
LNIAIHARAALAVAGFCALGAAAAAAPLHMEERLFLLGATAASDAQVELGRLAVEKAQDERVRALAQDLLDHHEAATAELADLAREMGVQPVEALEPPIRHFIDELRGLEGEAFDAVYVNGQIPTLYTAGWIYEREARHGMDADVKATGEAQAAANEEHHDAARDLAAELEADLPEGPRPGDATFLVYAMNVDLSQVRTAELLAESAEDEEVRAFARRMVEDHRTSFDGLAAAAEARGIAPLKEPGPVAQRTREHLAELSGGDLDFDYASSQVIQHYEWFYRYEHEAIHGADPEVQALAAKGADLGKAHHDAALPIAHEQVSR